MPEKAYCAYQSDYRFYSSEKKVIANTLTVDYSKMCQVILKTTEV